MHVLKYKAQGSFLQAIVVSGDDLYALHVEKIKRSILIVNGANGTIHG